MGDKLETEFSINVFYERTVAFGQKRQKKIAGL